MFALKIYRHGGEKTVMSCARYTVCESFPLTQIYAYPSHREEQPQVFELELSPDADRNVYYEMFVENETGKTIDRYRALSSNPEFNRLESVS